MDPSLAWAIARARAGHHRAADRHVLPADARHRRVRRRRRGLAGPRFRRCRSIVAAWSCRRPAATACMLPREEPRSSRCRRSTPACRRASRAGSTQARGSRACAIAARAGTRASKATRRWSRARCSTCSPPMAIRSRSPRSAPPRPSRAGRSTMFWKLGDRGRRRVGASVVPALCAVLVWVLVIGVVVAFVIEGVRIVPQQSAWVVERLGPLPRHARAGPEPDHPVPRPRRLRALAEGSAARRARAGVHHQGQHPARRSTASSTTRSPIRGSPPTARRTTSPRSPSSRRPRCAA